MQWMEILKPWVTGIGIAMVFALGVLGLVVIPLVWADRVFTVRRLIWRQRLLMLALLGMGAGVPATIAVTFYAASKAFLILPTVSALIVFGLSQFARIIWMRIKIWRFRISRKRFRMLSAELVQQREAEAAGRHSEVPYLRVTMIGLLLASSALAFLGLILLFGTSSHRLQQMGFLLATVFVPATVLGFRALEGERKVKCSNSECDADISQDTSWKCGTCQNTNASRKYALLSACNKCGAKPRVYYCPHCSTPKFLTDEHLLKPYAFHPSKADPVIAQSQQAILKSKAEEITRNQSAVLTFVPVPDSRELLEQKRTMVEMAKCDLELSRLAMERANYEQPREQKQTLDSVEANVKSLLERINRVLGAEQATEIVRQQMSLKFSDKAKMLSRIECVIKEFLEERT